MLLLSVLDAHSTALAVSRGASELNPLVALTLSNPFSFIIFNIAKAVLLALFGLCMKLDARNLTLYMVIAALYVNAIITNYVNARAL